MIAKGERIEGGAAGEDRLANLYARGAREIRQTLRGIGRPGFDGAKAEDARRRVKAIKRVLDEAALAWAARDIRRVYELQSRRAQISLAILGRKKAKATAQRTAANAVADAAEILLKANRSIPKTVDEYIAGALAAARAVRSLPENPIEITAQEFADGQLPTETVQRWAAKAMREEQARGDLQARIRAYLEDEIAEEGFITIGERTYAMAKYAKMVARTELRVAQTKATKDLCAQFDNDLVEFSDHGTDCEECAPFEGQIYSLSGQDPEYPALEEEPPIHPNCKHSILPTSIEAIAARGEQQ